MEYTFACISLSLSLLLLEGEATSELVRDVFDRFPARCPENARREGEKGKHASQRRLNGSRSLTAVFGRVRVAE